MPKALIELDMNDSDFQAGMAKFRRLTGASVEDCVKQVARTALLQILKYTPPGGRNVQGAAAKRALEGRIEGDFAGIFAPRKLKAKRREKHPNLASIHRAQPWKRKGTAIRKAPRNPVLFVSERKYNALLKEKKKHVGRMAAGWIRALDYLDAGKSVPAWVRRHEPGAGRVSPVGSGDIYSLEVENPIGYMTSQQATALAAFGISAGINGLEKAANAIIRRRARQARLELSH